MRQQQWLTKSQSKSLLVGAGGIGCELLKNIVLTGFGSVTIVDLDTIDLSNLNRQFLFNNSHIKKPKAIVAKEVASKFNPSVVLEAHHANIKETKFNIEWFAGFDLVFNALDNLEARRHVNKMCLAADVPLIESGTTGFNGQVQVIKKGRTECYDCNPKPVAKSYPVCTIRSTPSQPIHCIVWAKSYLLPELFGESEGEDAAVDTTEDSDNKEEIEKLRAEAAALKMIRESMGTSDFAQKVFNKVFTEDIQRLRSMEDMWKTRAKPTALVYSELDALSSPFDPASISLDDQRVWSISENLTIFKDSLSRLSARIAEDKVNAPPDSLSPTITFDKDDTDTLDFVTAAANLRGSIFGIEQKSKFDTKQMAGNIIPAIATTNAMTASLCVLEAFKVLKGDYGRAKTVFLSRGERMLGSDLPRPPNPECAVCGIATARVQVDAQRATLSDLVEGILKNELGYGDEISVNNEVGTVYDPDLEDNLPKKFVDLGINDESFLTIIDDEDENPRVNLQLSVSSTSLAEGSAPVVLPTKPQIARRPKKAMMNGEANGYYQHGASNGDVAPKRKRPLEDDDLVMEGTPQKKIEKIAKPSAKFDDDLVVVDGDDGAIVIDD